jgi:hypothetical protein
LMRRVVLPITWVPTLIVLSFLRGAAGRPLT